MRFDCVVFDLDGTLTASAPGIMRSAAYALEKMGREVPDESTLTAFVGPPLQDSFMRLTHLSPEDAEQAVKWFRERHREIGWKEASVYPGIFELLRTLKKSGVSLSVASSKNYPIVLRTLEYFSLSGFFDRVIAPDEKHSMMSKADLIRSALPEGCVSPCMVGDRRFDMEGAKGAGIYAIGAVYGYGSAGELLESGADTLCDSVSDLRYALLGDTPAEKGLFISFEGSDGCGKSTQLKQLKAYLDACGIETLATREPGGCPISERIREVLLDVKSMGMTDECEALLFAAARHQHVHDTIVPALEAGKIVLCDRFVDSSIAYQGAGRQLGDWVRQINVRAVGDCYPDLTLVFDLSPEESIARRYGASEADRIELSQSDFRQRTHEAFLSFCSGTDPRFVRIDASGDIEPIASRVRQIVMERIQNGGAAK